MVYGYQEPINIGGTSPIDYCSLWIRKAINWLARFSRLDQNYILPVSVRQLSSAQQWSDGIQNGKWDIEIKQALFPDQ